MSVLKRRWRGPENAPLGPVRLVLAHEYRVASNAE